MPAPLRQLEETETGRAWVDVPVETVVDTPPQVPRRPWLGWLRLLGAVGPGEVLVALGLLLLGRGCYMVYPALGYIAPGLVLLWYALPQRPRFLEHVKGAKPEPPLVRSRYPQPPPIPTDWRPGGIA